MPQKVEKKINDRASNHTSDDRITLSAAITNPASAQGGQQRSRVISSFDALKNGRPNNHPVHARCKRLDLLACADSESRHERALPFAAGGAKHGRQ